MTSSLQKRKHTQHCSFKSYCCFGTLKRVVDHTSYHDLNIIFIICLNQYLFQCTIFHWNNRSHSQNVTLSTTQEVFVQLNVWLLLAQRNEDIISEQLNNRFKILNAIAFCYQHLKISFIIICKAYWISKFFSMT